MNRCSTSTLVFYLSLLCSTLLLGTAFAQPTTSNQTRLLLDGRDLGTVSYTLSGGHTLLPLTAFAALGWTPLLDSHNQVVDLAGCVRVRTTGREAYRIGGPGVIGVRSASALRPLPVAPQLRQGHFYLPAKALASYLQYTVVFDKAGGQLRFSTPTDPAKINPTTEACLRNVTGGS